MKLFFNPLVDKSFVLLLLLVTTPHAGETEPSTCADSSADTRQKSFGTETLGFSENLLHQKIQIFNQSTFVSCFFENMLLVYRRKLIRFKWETNDSIGYVPIKFKGSLLKLLHQRKDLRLEVKYLLTFHLC